MCILYKTLTVTLSELKTAFFDGPNSSLNLAYIWIQLLLKVH